MTMTTKDLRTEATKALTEAEAALNALVVLDAMVGRKIDALVTKEHVGPYVLRRVPEENKEEVERLQASRPALCVEVSGTPGHHVSAIYPQNRTAWKNHRTRTVYRVNGRSVSRAQFLEAMERAMVGGD